MKKHTHVGDLVFEPFSGSGSQLIAAERTGRRCRAIEISPPFVDVAIRRWQKATGNEATLDGDGRTFAEIAVERGLARASGVAGRRGTDTRGKDAVARDAHKAGQPYQGRKELETSDWPPSVRSMLFEEALFAPPKIRDLARAQIGVEVAYGGDVESPGFGARHGLPMYGSIALHMSGWRQRLVRPPYEFTGDAAADATRQPVRADPQRR
jgi:hypothetical protein